MNLIQVSRLFALLLTVFLVSCSSMDNSQTASVNMTDADVVWIDVRTLEEYENDHINGDLNIPIQTFSAAAITSQLGLNQDTRIGLYCASGGRAGRALTILEDAGFTNAFNAGGIGDARDQRQLR
ncbi:MAG: sulfurtransferase [SAR86 cluster bacterium]|uniref:Sulfurtransferase n=1 Tax=SAR86 cluster bacterium TaxID=2030880 RepID=A0A2A5CCH9_9GAMM|nr:MAG: sulfurtransferase [SAR86 cluster bacterium]